MERLSYMESISLKLKIIGGLVLALLLIALASAVYAWYVERMKPPVSSVEYIKVPEIKEVIKIKRVEVPIEKIVTIEKKVIVEKLKLPDWFRDNEAKQAIATAVIEPYEGRSNAVAVVDTKSGEGEIIVRQEPLGLAGFVNDKRLYAKAGYSTNTEAQVTVGAEWRFFRVGSVKVGAFGEGRAAFGAREAGSRYPVEAVAGVLVTY